MNKLLLPLVFSILLINFCTLSSHKQAVRADELRHGVVKEGTTTTTTEGTSIDNHHAIPRPEYDSWSSPGNMPGDGHQIGSQEAKP
ncbi:hypothetical protein PAHAL_9G410600 [Panicum hallii]|jgi:hypothetical protein|uniref:Uncharacterized protein n=1 Tax=Panicum hallii TaxID=206008 RepID=A0A2T8I488_9POAL|nr:hypothetical protein PAHAL_9G410600 [Panicum hallii]